MTEDKRGAAALCVLLCISLVVLPHPLLADDDAPLRRAHPTPGAITNSPPAGEQQQYGGSLGGLSLTKSQIDELRVPGRFV